MSWKAELVERGWVPDVVARWGMRGLLRGRLRKERAVTADFLEQMSLSPLALATELANVQHYEVPAEFFSLVLGPRHKYSC